ncbi:MAG: ATP-binding protein, partial [Pseudomonadota bacterium]
MAAMAIAGIFGALLSSFAVRNARRLEIALVDARAADRAKTDFIANVSHELRTPMNGIIGLGEVLKHTELDQNQSSLLDVMMTSAQSQMGLIRELLEISQIDAKNRTLQARRFDLSGLVGEVVDLARAQSTEKGIDLRFNVAAAETYNVIGDDGAVRQIMTNLVGNALKFTDEGFVSVEMSLEPVDDIGICRIAVTDTGPGIQAEDIERIFERFFQVDGSETRERGGTGLGLSISKSLAEMLGGEIAVESTPGKGSTFTLTAPFVVARIGDEALARAA